MKQKKTWLILGPAEGLGPAAVKYLSAHDQRVIALDAASLSPVPAAIPGLVKHKGINYIINNTNYRLFHDSVPDIKASADSTISLLTMLTAFLSQEPPGIIINVPPQLCLATLDDPTGGPELLRCMHLFLQQMKNGLARLGYPLHFIEPGERLFDPSYI